ncbi:iron-containing alcohol dehydrogenase [Candidatus Poribacteria bacterium]|nr:iron-containing alcohol dehydrogenase [Candidatus Poribacteria bacterium]
MPTDPWNKFHFPATIECGAGCALAVGRRIRRIEAERPLVVSDPGVVQAHLVAPIIDALERAGCQPTLFSDIRPNPTDKNVYAGSVRYREGHCDSIVAVGGGSVMDAAKAIRILVSHPNALPELYADAGGVERISRPMPRLICIPTTAGTGSEVSRGAVITDTSEGRKRVVLHPRMSATIALLDPNMTVHLPKFLTAATGADAFAHCVEGYSAKGYHPIAEGIALQGIRTVVENLPVVVEEPSNIEARGRMLLAASMGALAIQRGAGAAHALSHPLSHVSGIHHGMASAIVLPAVVRFNLAEVPARLAQIAYAMGVDPCSHGPEAAAEALSQRISDLLARLGLPLRLRDAGVRREDLPSLAAAAARDDSHRTNPRTCAEADLLSLYEEVY